MRIHQAASRGAELARSMRALIVLGHLLALGDRNLRPAPLEERRRPGTDADPSRPRRARSPEQRSSTDENRRSLS